MKNKTFLIPVFEFTKSKIILLGFKVHNDFIHEFPQVLEWFCPWIELIKINCKRLANPEPLKNILYPRIPENNEDIKQNNSNCKTVTRLIMF